MFCQIWKQQQQILASFIFACLTAVWHIYLGHKFFEWSLGADACYCGVFEVHETSRRSMAI
jgi:hypothetical protein